MSSPRDNSGSKPSNKLIALFESYKDSNPDNAIPGRIVSVQAFNGVSMEDVLQKWTDSSFPQLVQFQQKDALGYLFSSKCTLDGKTKEVTIRFSPEGDDSRFATEGVIPPFFFWIDKPSVLSLPDQVIAAVQFIERSNFHEADEIDIGYGDYVLQEFQRQIDKIPARLIDRYTFESNDGYYLFIQTFPNNQNNYRLIGKSSNADIVISNNRHVIRRLTKKPFPRKYSDFQELDIWRYQRINFVDQSEAREAREEIIRQEQNGNTIMSLWKAYSEVEFGKAKEFKDNLGEISYQNAVQLKNGRVRVQLVLSDEKEEFIRNEMETVLASSFEFPDVNNNSERAVTLSLNALDLRTYTAEFLDEDYELPQNSSGKMVASIVGNETVNKRREFAMKRLDNPSMILLNLRLAIEGRADAMTNKKRETYKPLSDRTRKFIKTNFGIDNLTPDQLNAVDYAINTPDIVVIQGPPGTGKSTVIAVIAERLMEIAEKEADKMKGDEKIILVSAFQNDTVEHIASKILTLGIPTTKAGKDTQSIRAETQVIRKMEQCIDLKLQALAPKVDVNRISKKLEEIKNLYVAERLAERAKKQINDLIFSSDLQFSLSDELRQEWRGLYRQSTKNKGKAEDYIKAIKGLRTELVPYNDDGDMKAYEALTCGIVFTEEEKKLLDEAPFENPSDEYLRRLKFLQDKYLQQIYSELNEVPQGEDIDLETWLNDAISFFKQKEETDYEDKDTFFTAILEDVRDDLFGNSKYIRDAIQLYGESIAATNQIAGGKEVNDFKYKNVILEEAARSNPLDLLIPMVRASERIILVGDQKQLPHLLERDIVDKAITETEAEEKMKKKKAYEQSLFGLLYNNLADAKPTRRIMLSNQFRMHPVIGNFISNTYYDGGISSELVNPEKKRHGLELPWAKDKVMVFCNVPRIAGPERAGRSKVRLSEARRIVSLLKEIESDPSSENLSIGIITFYSKQVDLISEEAEKAGYTVRQKDGSFEIAKRYKQTRDGREKLRIGSVDSFQGKEFDIVILSTVRSNDFQRTDANYLKVFGFLTLENRLNVAFSRAQKLVIAVGDAEMFADDFAKTYVNGMYEFYKLTDESYGSRIQ